MFDESAAGAHDVLIADVDGNGKPDVVMIGDSLTDGAEWREIFPDQKIVNRGIDSDTTDGVLARLDEIVSIKPSPNKAGVFRCVTTTPLGLRLVRSVSVARGIEGLAGKLA